MAQSQFRERSNILMTVMVLRYKIALTKPKSQVRDLTASDLISEFKIFKSSLRSVSATTVHMISVLSS